MDAFADRSNEIGDDLGTYFIQKRQVIGAQLLGLEESRTFRLHVNCSRECDHHCVPKPSSSITSLRERIESILQARKLTLHRVSQLSERVYGRSSKYFVPHNFYYELRRGAFTPSIYQFAALSRITGYRLGHWLAFFGFDLDEIARLQAAFPAKRTLLIDSSWSDRGSAGAWPSERGTEMNFPRVMPVAEIVARGELRRASPISGISREFLYAKIGWEDALAFPDLLPGSIVGVVRESGVDSLPESQEPSTHLFLVEHSKGLWCCRLRRSSTNLLVPVSRKLPFGQAELRYPTEIRILGRASYEIRSLAHSLHPQVPADLARRWTPALVEPIAGLGRLLRNRRQKLQMSLQTSSSITRRIADELNDDRYFISPSSLSDYEASDTPPRHFHKIISLCALYGIQLFDFLESIGIVSTQLGSEAVPREFPPAKESWATRRIGDERAGSDPIARLAAILPHVPFFLRRSIAELSGIPEPSLEDFFWIGGEANPLHPSLRNGLLAIVNRRKKKAVHNPAKPIWEQPIYLLLLRGGGYVCACCSLEDHDLVLHPYPQQVGRALQLRDQRDAEVIGQIVLVVRKLE